MGCHFSSQKPKNALKTASIAIDTIPVYCPFLYQKDSLRNTLDKLTFELIPKPKKLICPGNSCHIHRLKKLNFDNDLSGELICFFNENTSAEEVYLYLFGKSGKLLHIPILMAEIYSYEGVDAERNSWILDYNHDGLIDIYTKFISKSYVSYSEDSTRLVIKKEEFLVSWNLVGKFDTIHIDNFQKRNLSGSLKHTGYK